MLQPANRLTLIDAMRPPAGYCFDSAMAVTYTLDLRALLAAPAALALTGRGHLDDPGTDDTAASDDTGERDRAPTTYEPVELIHALRSHAGKLTVFSQTGEIGLPPARRVFAFLERAIVAVTAPRGGVVHPKAWVLRYEAAGDPTDGQAAESLLRVLIASRNLTFDTSWDTVVRLDEATGSAGVRLEPVGALFEGLLRRSTDRVSTDHQERVRSLSAALQGARFALPAGVDDLRVHILGLADTPSPLPADPERSLIISPFVSDDFFTRVHPFRIDELVSRPESLDRLNEALLPEAATEEPALRQPKHPDRPTPNSSAAVGRVCAFDDGSAPDIASDTDRLSPLDPGQPLVGLHAKVFAFEDDGRARLFLGSANATGAAFGNNVEILVELAGSTSVLGIDRLCEGSDDEPGLGDLFYDYRRTRIDDGDSGVPSLDQWRGAIARLPVKGHVEASGDGWAVTYRTTEPLPVPADAAIRCWPLTVAGDRRTVASGMPLEERFETSLENLSGFLAFELAHTEGELSRFVVPAPLVGVPERRDRLLLRCLIGNAERFFRYLMALLDDDPAELSLLDTIERISDDPGAPDGGGSMSLPVLEKLLRTMRRDPAKLAGLHPLVSDLAADDALPPGFAEFWDMIHDVATTETQRPARADAPAERAMTRRAAGAERSER